MKVLILLFFTFTFPITLFLTAMLYGGITPEIIKTQLAASGIYEKLHGKIETFNEDETENQQLTTIITSRFSSSYIQSKTEGVIDDTSSWIIGKTATSPSISFKEVKEDILAENPALLTTLEEMSAEVKNQPIAVDEESDGESAAETHAQMTKTADMLTSLAKSDFTFDLSNYLTKVKNFYTIIHIAQPVLIVLLILCLFFLGLLNKSWPSRLGWIGETLLVSSIWGFGVITLNKILVDLLSKFLVSNTNEYVTLFSPLVMTITSTFTQTYISYQKTVSITFLVIAVFCFVGMVVIKRQSPVLEKVKPLKKK